MASLKIDEYKEGSAIEVCPEMMSMLFFGMIYLAAEIEEIAIREEVQYFSDEPPYTKTINLIPSWVMNEMLLGIERIITEVLYESDRIVDERTRKELALRVPTPPARHARKFVLEKEIHDGR